MEAGWMLVVLTCAVLAYRRVGRDTAHDERLKALEIAWSMWPPPDDVLARLADLEKDLDELTKSGNTMKQVVDRANELTKDMLALKGLVAEHREVLTALRTKSSLRQASGLDG